MYIQWITLHVKDMFNSRNFYEGFMGLPCTRSFSPRPGMQIAFFKAENAMEIELIEEPGVPAVPIQGVSIGITSSKYDEILEKSRQAGFLTEEPRILGGNLECFFIKDPDGMGLQIIRG